MNMAPCLAIDDQAEIGPADAVGRGQLALLDSAGGIARPNLADEVGGPADADAAAVDLPQPLAGEGADPGDANGVIRMGTIDHEGIERAYTEPHQIVDALPETTESKRAKFHLSESERYAHEAAERARVIDREAPPAEYIGFKSRGPALSGWPWRIRREGD